MRLYLSQLKCTKIRLQPVFGKGLYDPCSNIIQGYRVLSSNIGTSKAGEVTRRTKLKALSGPPERALGPGLQIQYYYMIC